MVTHNNSHGFSLVSSVQEHWCVKMDAALSGTRGQGEVAAVAPIDKKSKSFLKRFLSTMLEEHIFEVGKHINLQKANNDVKKAVHLHKYEMVSWPTFIRRAWFFSCFIKELTQ